MPKQTVVLHGISGGKVVPLGPPIPVEPGIEYTFGVVDGHLTMAPSDPQPPPREPTPDQFRGDPREPLPDLREPSNARLWAWVNDCRELHQAFEPHRPTLADALEELLTLRERDAGPAVIVGRDAADYILREIYSDE